MIRAGFSTGRITPAPGALLQGNWGAIPSHAVLRPLEVRAIVFESGGQRVAIATVDVIGVTKPTTDRIRARVVRSCGIPGDHVMVVCSHTHCAPATLPCMGVRPSSAWLHRIETHVAACIDRAARTPEPVTLGVGCGTARFNSSRRPARPSATGRRDHLDPVDRRVRVLRVDRENGSALGVIFHYACHATVMSSVAGLISPDYPGVAREWVETFTGGTALFLPGCSGDLRPIPDGRSDSPPSAATSALAAHGWALGDEICRVARGLQPYPSASLRVRRADVEIPFGDPLPVERLRELASDQTDLGRGLIGPWARRVLELIETRTLPRTRHSEMQVLSVGPLTCVALPGEPLQAVGHAVEQALRGATAPEGVWPVGYANDEVGYLCTAAQYEEGGYEPTAYPFYGEPAPFRGEVDVILDCAEGLVRDLRSPWRSA